MTDKSDYDGHPGDLTENETLARLTVDEKASIARDAILEFPHINQSMVHEWLTGYDVADRVTLADSLHDKVEALVDGLQEKVEAGEEPEALDHFIYGYLYPANLREHGIDPEEVVEREPLDVWEGVYEP